MKSEIVRLYTSPYANKDVKSFLIKRMRGLDLTSEDVISLIPELKNSEGELASALTEIIDNHIRSNTRSFVDALLSSNDSAKAISVLFDKVVPAAYDVLLDVAEDDYLVAKVISNAVGMDVKDLYNGSNPESVDRENLAILNMIAMAIDYEPNNETLKSLINENLDLVSMARTIMNVDTAKVYEYYFLEYLSPLRNQILKLVPQHTDAYEYFSNNLEYIPPYTPIRNKFRDVTRTTKEATKRGYSKVKDLLKTASTYTSPLMNTLSYKAKGSLKTTSTITANIAKKAYINAQELTKATYNVYENAKSYLADLGLKTYLFVKDLSRTTTNWVSNFVKSVYDWISTPKQSTQDPVEKLRDDPLMGSKIRI